MKRPNHILVRNGGAGDPFTPDLLIALTVLRLYLDDDADHVAAYASVQRAPANFIRDCGRGVVFPCDNAFQRRLSSLYLPHEMKTRLYLASGYTDVLSHALSLSREALADGSLSPWRVCIDRVAYYKGTDIKRDGVRALWPCLPVDDLVRSADPSLTRVYRGHAATNDLMQKLSTDKLLRRYLTMSILAGDFVGGIHTERLNLYYSAGGRVTLTLSPTDDPYVDPLGFSFDVYRSDDSPGPKRRFHIFIDAPAPNEEIRPLSAMQFVPRIKGADTDLDRLQHKTRYFLMAACYGGLIPYCAAETRLSSTIDVYGMHYDAETPEGLACYKKGVSSRSSKMLPGVWEMPSPKDADVVVLMPNNMLVTLLKRQYIECPEMRPLIKRTVGSFLRWGKGSMEDFFEKHGQGMKEEEIERCR